MSSSRVPYPQVTPRAATWLARAPQHIVRAIADHHCIAELDLMSGKNESEDFILAFHAPIKFAIVDTREARCQIKMREDTPA